MASCPQHAGFTLPSSPRLYREQGFGTFEEYCEKRWGMGRRNAYNHIQAAKAAENVQTFAQTQPSFGQSIELATLPAAQQREVVRAVEESGKGLLPLLPPARRRGLLGLGLTLRLSESVCGRLPAARPEFSEPFFQELLNIRRFLRHTSTC